MSVPGADRGPRAGSPREVVDATGLDFQMKELLSRMVGQEVDVLCTGTSSLRGKVVKVEGDVLHLKDDEGNVCYVSIDKITAVWEKRNSERHPGFVFKT